MSQFFSENEVYKRNDHLCRNHYSIFESKGSELNSMTPVNLRWFRINGVTQFWKDQPQEEYADVFENILSGITRGGSVIAFLVNGTEAGINFYVGVTPELYDTVKGSYAAYIPGIDITDDIPYSSIDVCCKHIGVLTGHPGENQNNKEHYVPLVLQIDDFCRGMLGSKFSFLVIANRDPEQLAQAALKCISNELFICSDQLVVERAGTAGINRQITNYPMQKYFNNLTLYSNFMENCIHNGFWHACIYYSANDEFSLSRLKGVIRGAYSSDSTVNFEGLHCIDINNPASGVIREPAMATDVDKEASMHPFNTLNNNFSFYRYMYQTYIDSHILSIFIRLPQKEYAGYYIDSYVEFDTTVRKKSDQQNGKELLIGDITYPGRNVFTQIDNKYNIPLDDLTRHALIIGITGGGKTNTSKSLLRELWIKNHIPFLVIESAKREYWELINITGENMLSSVDNPQGFQNLNLFTLGWEADTDSIKYRINPFEAAPGVSLQTHIDYLLSTFKAAFELYSPMPYVLESAVYEVYSDRGWDIVNSVNKYGRDDYPTLTDLYYKIDPVTDRLGYNPEVRSNVKAALKARINSLRIGGKGAMLDTAKSLDIGKLLETPTVFELEDLGDDDTKSFVIGILLVQLYEYRKGDRTAGGKSLKSVLMIEEAHRLLKNVPQSSGDNSRAKSVEFFCNMLAEIRSFGQGIIIADQVPTKLAPDTIKNTNLKIVHRTVMAEDRKTIGESMNMTPDQVEYISSLIRGCAAVFAEGDSRPKLVKMPYVKPERNLTRTEALSIIKKNVYGIYGDGYDIRYSTHLGCSFCSQRGIMCDSVKKIVSSAEIKACIAMARKLAAENGWTLTLICKIINQYVKVSQQEISIDQKICLLGYLVEILPVKSNLKMDYIVRYFKNLYKTNR